MDSQYTPEPAREWIGLIGPVAHSLEWHQLRSLDRTRSRPMIIGASSIAEVIGWSPHETPYGFFCKAIGDYRNFFNARQREKMKWGQRQEPGILLGYQERTGRVVQSAQPMFFHPEFPWMAATPDGFCLEPIGSGLMRGRLIEAKATTTAMLDRTGENPDAFGEEGTDQVPRKFLAQAQQQMAVTGMDVVDFPVLIDGWDLRMYTVERCEATIDLIKRAGSDMVRRVLEDDPPEISLPTDAAADASRRRPREARAALSGDWERVVSRVQWLTEQMNKMKTEKAILNAKLSAACGTAKRAELPDGRMIVRAIRPATYHTAADADRARERIGQEKTATTEVIQIHDRKGES